MGLCSRPSSQRRFRWMRTRCAASCRTFTRHERFRSHSSGIARAKIRGSSGSFLKRESTPTGLTQDPYYAKVLRDPHGLFQEETGKIRRGNRLRQARHRDADRLSSEPPRIYAAHGVAGATVSPPFASGARGGVLAALASCGDRVIRTGTETDERLLSKPCVERQRDFSARSVASSSA